MGIASQLEHYVKLLIETETERVKLETELFFNPRLQKRPEQVQLMRKKIESLFEKSLQIKKNLFGYDDESKEVQ